MSHLQWPKQILIADQQAIFAEGLNSILSKVAFTETVTVVRDQTACFYYLKHHQPHLVLMDISFTDIPLNQFFEYLSKHSIAVPVVIMGITTEAQIIMNSMALPIAGYLMKTCSTEELLEAIKQVMQGQKYYCAKTTMLMQQLVVSKQYHPHRKLDKQVFTAKEISILELICAEYTSKAIADQLNMSVRTVEAYRKTMQEKTGSKNSAGLILYAIKHGIVDVSNQSLPSAISV